MADEFKNITKTADYSGQFDPRDTEDNKILSLFSYLGILFLIPLLAAPNSKYARFHVNQGLILFIADIILGAVCSVLAGVAAVLLFIPVVGAVLAFLVGLVGLVVGAAVLVLAILGIVNAVTGKAKELPIIGKFRIIK